MCTTANTPIACTSASGKTRLHPDLVAAYRRTDYRVGSEFSLRIDQYSAALRDWQRGHGVDCSAFLSAVNPYSLRVDEAENQSRHKALRLRLERQLLPFAEGAGVDPEEIWPPEAAFLIGGLALDAACCWGRDLEQNALVWSGEDAVPRLVLLR